MKQWNHGKEKSDKNEKPKLTNEEIDKFLELDKD